MAIKVLQGTEYAVSHSDVVKMRGERKTLTQKMTKVDDTLIGITFVDENKNVIDGNRYIHQDGNYSSSGTGSWRISPGFELENYRGCTIHFYRIFMLSNVMLSYALYSGNSMNDFIANSGYITSQTDSLSWGEVDVDTLLQQFPTAKWIRFTLHTENLHYPYLTKTGIGLELKATHEAVEQIKGQMPTKQDYSFAVQPLVRERELTNYQLTSDFHWKYYSNGSNQRKSECFYVQEGDVIHLESPNSDTEYAFLDGIGTPNNASTGTATAVSELFGLEMGNSVDIVAPKNAHYLYVASEKAGTSQLPLMAKYAPVVNVLPNISFTTNLVGKDDDAFVSRTFLKGGKTYIATLDKTSWNTSSSTSSSSPIFALVVNNEIIANVRKSDGVAEKTYQFDVPENVSSVEMHFVFRGSVGETVGVTIADNDSNQNTTSQNSAVSLIGAGMTSSYNYFNVLGGHTYMVSLTKNDWGQTSISNGYSVFILNLGGNVIRDVKKGSKPKKNYYFHVEEDARLTIGYRADVGCDNVVSIKDVSTKFNKLIYDVHFVVNSGVATSMLVKLSEGDLVRYRVNANANSTPIKMYSRAVRNGSYLVEQIDAESGGVLEGIYIPTSDVYMVMESVVASGFTPKFEVYNYGEYEKGKCITPYQLVFDTDNQFTILSPLDEDADAVYEENIFYGQIIGYKNYFCMLYYATGTASGNNILMAYSEDGTTWHRGFPSGIEAPYTGTNVIFKKGSTHLEHDKEVINEFAVCKVNDSEYPYRMFANARGSSIVGEKAWLLKSSDLAHWVPVRRITEHAHDTFPSLISYGDYIKVYLRMWDYGQSVARQRMIGEMFIDLCGNVIVPPSGIGGYGWYQPSATRIGNDKELLITTNFIASSTMKGDNTFEAYIKNGDEIRWCPCYGIDNLKKPTDNDGWGYGQGLVGIGLNQYFLYGQRNAKHDISFDNSELRLCPVRWITYDSYNTDGE